MYYLNFFNQTLLWHDTINHTVSTVMYNRNVMKIQREVVKVDHEVASDLYIPIDVKDGEKILKTFREMFDSRLCDLGPQDPF